MLSFWGRGGGNQAIKNASANHCQGHLCSMDTKTTDSIITLLAALRADALKAFKMQVRKIYASADDPRYIPESIVNEAVRLAEENAGRLLGKAVSGALTISEAPDAFPLVHDAVAAHLLDLERTVENGNGLPLSSATLKVVGTRFDAARQRSYQSLENHRSSFSGSKNKGGRPSEWKWEDVLIHLIAQANLPDGLSTERSGQAHIEKIITDWFMQKTGNSPAPSEIRKRASAIMKAISRDEKAGN